MTVVGSSNYSMRSYKRDSECNFFIFSECEDFRSKMKEEVDYLFSNATKVNLDIIRKDKEMKLGLVKRFAANRLRSFLYSSIPSRRALEASFSSSNFTCFDEISVPIFFNNFHYSFRISNQEKSVFAFSSFVHRWLGIHLYVIRTL